MKDLIILLIIIFSVLIAHYYITKKVESFFNYKNDSWNKNSLEHFYSKNEQLINPALLNRKKRNDTALMPIKNSNLDYYDSYHKPNGLLNNQNIKIQNCSQLSKHRGEQWNNSYSYKDPACCNPKLNMCCCLGNNCGPNVNKCSDLINIQGNSKCDLNKDNNCIHPVYNNYTNKSRDIWGKNEGKWKYMGKSQDIGVINNEYQGIQDIECDANNGSSTVIGYSVAPAKPCPDYLPKCKGYKMGVKWGKCI